MLYDSAMLLRLACALIVTSLCLGGCVAPTYVNIPSQGGIAASDPNSFNVRDIVADSVAAAMEREPLEGPYEVLLPEGTSQETYLAVVRQIGGGAVTPDTLRDRPLPSVRVVAVRVRNHDAECDLVRPSPTGRPVVRVFSSWSFGGGWTVQRVKPLRIAPADLLLQTSPPPAEPIAPAEGGAA